MSSTRSFHHSFRSNNSQNIKVDDDDQRSQNNKYKHRSADNYLFPSTYYNDHNNDLSRNSSKRVNPPKSSMDYCYYYSSSSSPPPPTFFGKIPSTRHSSNNNNNNNNNPIMFSNSSGMLKPPPIEKKLECTLEELCYGCQKKLKITRDVINDLGRIVEEEELLTIKVKPGWKKGTKITFEGMGNEKAGSYPADIIFIIAEKRHQLFRREGDDLEFAIRIPLVKALTGCKISIPLLGGEKMRLTVDDVIHPGFVKIVPNQGMTVAKDRGIRRRRGDLRVVFLVDFPSHLSDHQRLDVLTILQDEG
ncbi:uncharacterized protein LOC133803471 [Humulus lupulus]|uniref:uncharacterized protein LOC133803471 n=1 Tax=Humulus lupulus TaxID=3486 RepID=UPI002B40D71F|nr:uncharacterized protein LOC133803471 [Humulus lupulus]